MIVLGGTALVIVLVIGCLFLVGDIVGKARRLMQARRQRSNRNLRR